MGRLPGVIGVVCNTKHGNKGKRVKGRDGRNLGALVVEAEGGRVFLYFFCYSVTESWKPLPIQAFRRNRFRNDALSATLRTPQATASASRTSVASQEKTSKTSTRSPSVTEHVTPSVTKSVADSLLP